LPFLREGIGNEVVIAVVFEGLPNLRSEVGKSAQVKMFEEAAESICLSVE